METNAKSKSHNQFVPGSPVVTLVAAALLCLMLIVGYFLRVGYQHAIRAVEVETRNLAKVMESRLSSEFSRVDGVLSFIAHEVQSAPFDSRLAAVSEGQSQYLVRMVTSFPNVAGLFAFDASGMMQIASNPGVKPYSIADRLHFQTLRDNPHISLVFSEPLMSRSTGQWSLIQARSIRDDAGQFLGVVTAVLHMDTFSDLFRSVEVGAGGAILLRRSDNFKLVTRSPRYNEKDFNQPLPAGNPIRERLESGAKQDTLAFTASTDGVQRIGSFVKLDERFPFYVQVSFARDHYLFAWRQQAMWMGLLVMILLLAFGVALVRLVKGDRLAAMAQQKTLHESEKNSALLRHASDGIAILDVDGLLVECSDSFCAMLGYARDELIGMHLAQWSEGYDTDALMQSFRQRLKASAYVLLESRHRRKDGSHYDVEISSVPVEIGGQMFLFNSYRNITKRKRIGAERDRLLKIIEEAPEFIALSDMQSHLVYLNLAGANMLGLTEDEDCSSLTLRNIHPESAARHIMQAVVPTVLKEGYWQGETTLLHRDGHEIPVSQLLLVHRDEFDKPAYVSTIMRDISQQKAYETQLTNAKEAAEAANVAKSRFLATMSHEIRTPMNGILGMAQLLLMPNLVERERREYARTILLSGQTLLTLLNDILDLSKIEAGKVQLDSTVFEPESLMRETQSLFSGAAQTKNLQMHCQWQGPSEHCYLADAHRLHQMLANLVGNAIKFTQQGWVRLEGTELERDGDTALLEFTVSDTGVGIPPDKIDLLFKPFSQTDSSTTRMFGGTGLGLSIVSQLARMMEGDAGVESVEGQGSKFWFRLRAKCVANEAASRSQEPSQSGGAASETPLAGIKVLVAEDNDVNRMVIESLLNKIGVSLTLAHDGQQALDALTLGERPDLILMDLHMPVMDGYLATEQIRQWESSQQLPRLPIIALTADAFEEDRQHCLAVGMDDFLTKPIALDALQSVLVKWQPRKDRQAAETTVPVADFLPLDRSLFVAQAQALLPLLAHNIFDALAQFKDLQALTAGTELAAAMDSMSPLVESFQFDEVHERLSKLAEVSQPVVHPPHNPAVARPKILAIDDVPANLSILRAALADEFVLQIANSGAAGLALAAESPPDLILLDVMMPEMDGFETFRRLKVLPTLAHIPIVFITAMHDMESEVTALALGAADYITKPIDVCTARLRLSNLLEREQLRRQMEHQRDQLATEITERKLLEDEVRQMAFYDPLTHLANRRLLDDRLAQSMAVSQRSARYSALMVLDLDKFKLLNDRYGHLVGDVLLIEAARRLSACVRQVDTVARFGGDEFVVILSELDTDKTVSIAQATAVAEKIRVALSAPYLLEVSQPYGAASTVKHHCTTSIGVVVFLGDLTNPVDILKRADDAMYRAKDDGRDVIRLFDRDAKERVDAEFQTKIENVLNLGVQ